MTAVAPIEFLPPAYANDSDAIDYDVLALRCESVCPLAEWLSDLRLYPPRGKKSGALADSASTVHCDAHRLTIGNLARSLGHSGFGRSVTRKHALKGP